MSPPLGLPQLHRLLAHQLLPVAPDMLSFTRLALTWGLADTLHLPPSFLRTQLGRPVSGTFLECKFPKGRALCLVHCFVPQFLEGCLTHSHWLIVSGLSPVASQLQSDSPFPILWLFYNVRIDLILL